MADSMQKVPEVQSKVGGQEGEFRSLENSEKINQQSVSEMDSVTRQPAYSIEGGRQTTHTQESIMHQSLYDHPTVGDISHQQEARAHLQINLNEIKQFNELQAQNIFIENDQITQLPERKKVPIIKKLKKSQNDLRKHQQSPQISVHLKIVDNKSMSPALYEMREGDGLPRISDINSQAEPVFQAKTPMNFRQVMNKTATNFTKKPLLQGLNQKKQKSQRSDDSHIDTSSQPTDSHLRSVIHQPASQITNNNQAAISTNYISREQSVQMEAEANSLKSKYLYKHYQFIMEGKGKKSPRSYAEWRNNQNEDIHDLVHVQQVGTKDRVSSIYEKYEKQDPNIAMQYLLIDERTPKNLRQALNDHAAHRVRNLPKHQSRLVDSSHAEAKSRRTSKSNMVSAVLKQLKPSALSSAISCSVHKKGDPSERGSMRSS